MATVTDTDLQQFRDLITSSSATTQKQIMDLTLDVKVGFANVETKFAKLEGDIRELRSELKSLDTKFEEKTKNLDQRITSREFITRGVAVGITVTIVGGLLLAFGKIIFFGKI
jgi:tetrahydromethanopterin S-methyltransferase subunit G